MRFFLLSIAIFQASFTFAQSNSTMDEIVTTTQRRDSSADSVGNIAQINEQQLREIGLLHIQDALVRVPGVSFQQGNGQEYLPSIRSAVLTGAGACGGFLTAQDSIPLRAAGFCNVNELFEANTEQAASIEVIRGPSNALYGSNALQGVVNVLLPSSPSERLTSFGIELGANDYRREKLTLGNTFGNHGFIVNLNTTHDGGFRDDAYFDQQKLSVRHDYSGDSWEIATTFAATNLNQETAGFILGDKVYKDKDIAESNPNPEAFRDANSFRLYSRFERDFGNDTVLAITPYFRKTEMDFLQHFLPGTPLEENGQESIGAQITWYDDRSELVSWIAGIDIENTNSYLRETQSGTAPAFGSAPFRIRPQGKHYDYEVDAVQIAPYVNVDVRLTEKLLLNAGLRIELMNYEYNNKMIDGNTADDGTPCLDGCRYTRPADRDDDFTNRSPKIGLSYKFSESAQLFTNYTHGFRAPQATELYRLQASQNVADLDSEDAKSVEFGLRGRNRFVSYEAVVYGMKKDNVIFRDNSDFSNVDNAKTKHRGLELALSFQIFDNLNLATTLNYAKHEFDGTQFVSGTNVGGNELDTAPKHFGSTQLQWRFAESAGAELEWIHMGKYFTDTNNNNTYDGHEVLNLRTYWQLSPKIYLDFKVLNLLREEYAERADFAFGNDRYFPGEPRSAYIGAEIKF